MNVSPDEFRELMAMSVNPNLQDIYGQSFLHIFAERHLLLYKRWLEVFLDSGVDFNLEDDMGREPFSKPYYVSGLGLVEFPAFHGDLKIWILIRDALVSAHSGVFEAAVGRLPSIDSTGPDGNNALHLAVQTRNLEFVKNFTAQGANINACNNDGKTVFHEC
jgi:Ankyrin repeats (many copies)